MCGCDCCINSNPTCFDPQLAEVSGEYQGWVCKCSCAGCISRVIRGATNTGYLNGVATNADNSFKAALGKARSAVGIAILKRGGYHSASEFAAVATDAIDALKGEQT